VSACAPKFQAMPPLAPDDLDALEKSIIEHGVMLPIIVDENGDIIDGHHREQIAKKHGMGCPRDVRTGFADAEKRAMALTLNIDRRHLTQQQKRQLLEKSITADPQLSDREHGRRTNTDHKTAAKVRTDLEQGGEIPHLDKRDNPQGRQPASKSKKNVQPEWDGSIVGAPWQTVPEPQPVVDDDDLDEVCRFWELRDRLGDEGYIEHYVDDVADITLCSETSIDTGTPLVAADLPEILWGSCNVGEYNDAQVAAELADKLTAVLPRIAELRDLLRARADQG
jgi:ParB-like chromosome segregation protein Spo0J